MIECYVCESPATITDEPAIAMKRLECPKCGTYSISYDFFARVPRDEHWDQVKPVLSLALYWASEHGTPAVLGDGGDVMNVVGAYQGALEQGE